MGNERWVLNGEAPENGNFPGYDVTMLRFEILTGGC